MRWQHFPCPPQLVERLPAWLNGQAFGLLLQDQLPGADPEGPYLWLMGFARNPSSARLSYWNQLEGRDPQAWYFGGLSYEGKNTLEPGLQSRHSALLPWPELALFRADAVLAVRKDRPDQLCVVADDAPALYAELLHLPAPQHAPLPRLAFAPLMPQPVYTQRVAWLQQHIYEGNIYEVNLTLPWLATGQVQPDAVFAALSLLRPAPMSAFFRWGPLWLAGASPERFLQLKHGQLLSQPIKGTARRHTQPQKDQALGQRLMRSPKNRAENLMIADLVRNDLNRVALPGSVTADVCRLCSFPGWHHLRSDIRAQLEGSQARALAAAFPPGSMTGAPKFRAMELIDEAELACRGLYSGALGYLAPTDSGGPDFDFAVVIRSFMGDENRLMYAAGGALTTASRADTEWEEMCLKAAPVQALFG